MSHRSKAHRGHAPDYFTMIGEEDPARGGWAVSWTWSDEPAWNVEVCRDCNFATGEQCAGCANERALYRRGDYDQRTRRKT